MTSWWEYANCLSADAELFFATSSDPAKTPVAKSLCSRCHVTADCLAYALADPTLDGVWGATTKRERQKIRKAAA